MIVLPKNTYKRDLLHWVYSFNVDEKDREEYDLLQKVCTCYLHNGNHAFQIDRIEITDVEKHLIEERKYIHAENEEVRARFMDVSIRAGLYKREKLSLKRECSNLYLCIAELQHDSSAFVRSILVRDVHTLWNDQYNSNLVEVIKKEDFSPYWILKVANRLKVNMGQHSTYIQEILETYANRLSNVKSLDFQWQLNYVDLILCFDKINKEEAHQKKALVYESEGDYTIKNKEPNTLYPNLHQMFQDAFNEIDKVKKKYTEDWVRIHDKLVLEKKEFVELLSPAGMHTKYEVSDEFQRQVQVFLMPQMNYDNPIDVLLLLMNAPYFSADKENIKKLQQKWSQESPILASCFNMVQVNSEGNTIGISTDDAGFKAQVHRYTRMHLLFYLWTIEEHFHRLRLQLDEEDVYGLLHTKSSKYVNNEQLILWSKGICAIVNGEPLLGSYILMPQIESIIRLLAEDILGDMTKLSQELQHEYVLGGILDRLKPHMSEIVNDELRLFLIDGCDTNLRNEMMHGLIKNPMQVQKYSLYILYIALNLYFREKQFLISN